MTHIGIHVLTAFPPSNPNRDENGQPKTAIVGGVTRQRISSQCIKRTWRMSDVMRSVEVQYSTRTRGIGVKAEEDLLASGMDAKLARKNAVGIASAFGKVDKKKEPQNSEMVVIGHEEADAVNSLVSKLGRDKREATEEELAALQKDTTSVDVAMFGRMRAANPSFNTDASVYVSHPLTTNKSVIDADFWTSVDDLKSLDEEADGGAGGMGDVEFGSVTYYTYIQVNMDALAKNLGGKNDEAKKVALKLIEAIATTSPSGHKATFGSEVRASFMRVEVGQPSGNLFSKAFEKPVNGTPESIKALKEAVDAETTAYGISHEAFEYSTADRTGTLKGVLASTEKALGLV